MLTNFLIRKNFQSSIIYCDCVTSSIHYVWKYPYASKADNNMYKNHNEINTVVQAKATLRGPPNSALPKAVTYRLAIIIANPVKDTAV